VLRGQIIEDVDQAILPDEVSCGEFEGGDQDQRHDQIRALIAHPSAAVEIDGSPVGEQVNHLATRPESVVSADRGTL
jgi:hypothetical protein